MRVIRLKRIVHDMPGGTSGVWIFDDGYPYFTSIELPWKNNQHDISRIPAGEYICDLTYSAKWGYKVYILRDVLNRLGIEIHIANSIHDILGCIGVGRSFGIVETKGYGEINGIQDSSIAFKQFMAMLRNAPQFKLVIED